MKSTQIRNLELRRLKWILKKVSDESDRNKILAAIAIKEGKQVAEVSRFFKISRQTIYSWIKVPERYFIFPKSRPRETRGRPAKWNSDMDRLLEKSLKKKPFDFNISALNW